MINYLERALRQNRAEEEEEQETGNRLLSETEEPSLPSLRSGIPGPPGAIRLTAVPAPDALTRALSRAAETHPLETEGQHLLSVGTDDPVFPSETEGRFLLSPGTKEPSLLSQSSGAVLTVPSREIPSQPLWTALRRSDFAADFVQRERRAFTVTLPEAPDPAPGLTAQGLDRAVERDARRYDGGFSLY